MRSANAAPTATTLPRCRSIRNRSGIASETIIVALRHAIIGAINATSKADDAASSMLASKLYGQSVKHAVVHHAMLSRQFSSLPRALMRTSRLSP